MTKIYQEFTLDEARQEKEDDKRQSIVTGRGKKLIQKLKERGYNVLISGTLYGGVSISIIVGAEKGKHNNIKVDFYDITNELGLFFSSGNWYHE